MKNRLHSDSPPEEVRAHALSSAIVLRDCSLREGLSLAIRRSCRKLMRTQAILWRHPGGENGAQATG